MVRMGGKSRAGTPTEQTVPHIPRMVMGVATQYFFHDSAIVFCPAHLAEFLCHSYMMTTKGRLWIIRTFEGAYFRIIVMEGGYRLKK